MKFYLEQLINTLHDSDIEKLKNIDLKRSKIKDMLSMLIAERHNGVMHMKQIESQFNQDSNAFRKMKAVLLERCMNALAPEGGSQLLELLGRYRLSELFIRESKQVISTMAKDKKLSAQARIAIYRECFFGYMRLPYSMNDSESLDKFREGLLSHYSGADKSTLDCILLLNQIFVRIVQSYFQLNISASNYEQFKKELASIEVRIQANPSDKSLLFLSAIGCVLDFYYTPPNEELRLRFEKLVAQYNTIGAGYNPDEIFAVNFYRAYYYKISSRFEESADFFQDLIAQFPIQFAHSPHIIYRYAVLLAVLGRIDEMKTLIDTHLKKYLYLFDYDARALACLVYSVYNMLINDTEVAYQYMNDFRDSADKKGMYIFNIGIRVFEIVLYYQRADEKFSEEQLRRFLRYIKDRSKNVPAFPNLYILMKNLHRCLQQLIKKNITLAEYEVQVRAILPGTQALLAVLLINAAKVRLGGKQ